MVVLRRHIETSRSQTDTDVQPGSVAYLGSDLKLIRIFLDVRESHPRPEAHLPDPVRGRRVSLLHGEIDVFSFGADGQPGGNGTDADIGSWDL